MKILNFIVRKENVITDNFRHSEIKRSNVKLTCPCIFIMTTVFVRLQTTMLSGFLGNKWTELTLTLPPAEAPIDLNVLIHSVVFVFQTFTVPSDEALINWCPSETKEKKSLLRIYYFRFQFHEIKRKDCTTDIIERIFAEIDVHQSSTHTSNHQPSKIWKHCSSYC